MTAATLTGMPLETRLPLIVSIAIRGTYDPDACICGEDDCVHVAEIRDVLDAAFRAVDRVPSGAAKTAIYMECWAKLTGIPESEWSVGITAGEGGAR